MTRSSLKRAIVVSAVLFSSILGSGCAVVAVGAIVGAIAYLDGELKAEVNGDIRKVVGATKAAARDLRLKPYSQTGDENGATMMATRSDGERVVVRLIPQRHGTTLVRIRAGGFGDEDYSLRVLRQIERYL